MNILKYLPYFAMALSFGCSQLETDESACSSLRGKEQTEVLEKKNIKHKEFILRGENISGKSETKSTISGGQVNWTEADPLYYYTGKGADISDITRYMVPKSGRDVIKFLVDYRDGDEDVVFFTQGSGTGGASTVNRTLTGLTITEGVPASQDGTFDGTHICMACASLSDGTAVLKPLQTFIKFKMSSLMFADKVLDKIVVTGGNETEDICGDIVIDMSGAEYAVSYDNEGTSITIDKTGSAFFVDTDYYVAVIGGGKGTDATGTKYTAGLKLKLYNGGDFLGVVEPDNETILKRGQILDLGDLQDHKKIPAKSVTMYPEYAAYTKDLPGGKKIWLKIEPSDFTGDVTWEATKGTSSKLTVTKGGAREDIPGGPTDCWVATVTNGGVTNYTNYTDGVKATVDNEDVVADVTKTCSLEIGKWIYLGFNTIATSPKKILWGNGYLTGSGTSVSIKTGLYSTNGTHWNKAQVQSNPCQYIADKTTGETCNVPSADDFLMLISKAYTKIEAVKNGTHGFSKYTSTVPGYTDVWCTVCENGAGGSDGTGRYLVHSRTLDASGNTMFLRSSIWNPATGTDAEFHFAFEEISLENLSSDAHTKEIWPVKYK